MVFPLLFYISTTILYLASHSNEYNWVIYKTIYAIILALDLVLHHENEHAKSVFCWVNNTALSETIFECSNMELPCEVITYGEDKRVECRLFNYDLSADDAWILVDRYKMFDDHGKLIGTLKYEAKYHLLVILSDIKCIKVDTNQGKPANYSERRHEEIDLATNEEVFYIMLKAK